MSDKRWEIDQIDDSDCYTVYFTNGVQRYFVGQSGVLQGTDNLNECLHKTAQELCDEWNAELDSKKWVVKMFTSHVYIYLDDDSLEHIGTPGPFTGAEKALKDFAQELCDQRNSTR